VIFAARRRRITTGRRLLGGASGRPLGGAAGQATIELIGVLPLCIAVALGAGQLLAAGAAHELAGTAAQAGAMAMLQGGDPARSARAALPGWSRSRLVVRVSGRTVRVRLRPVTLVPGLAGALAAEAKADAGPTP
jgi:hypothetical protein